MLPAVAALVAFVGSAVVGAKNEALFPGRVIPFPEPAKPRIPETNGRPLARAATVNEGHGFSSYVINGLRLTASAASDALYQGTTSVGPFRLNNNEGFSPWGFSHSPDQAKLSGRPH